MIETSAYNTRLPSVTASSWQLPRCWSKSFAATPALPPNEQRAVLRAVREKFGLSDEEAQTLFRLAEDEVRTANDYYQFTSLINRHFDQQRKQHVIELMWQVAYADSELAAHENHVLRRIAELLHVTHGDYIAAKMRARDAAERGQ